MDLLTNVKQEQFFLTVSVAYLGTKFRDEFEDGMFDNVEIAKFDKPADLERYIRECPMLQIPEVLLLELGDEISETQRLIAQLRGNTVTRVISIILLSFKGNRRVVVDIFKPLVNDIYFYPINVADVRERIKLILRFKYLQSGQPVYMGKQFPKSYEMPVTKRIFDVLVASLVLFMASPLLLLIAVFIKLDSKGPVLYKSKRAGTGYRIFDFYKFRSMRVNADKELAELSALNQYAANGGESAFVKIKDDPRVTKLGSFLRNTSLDELPQLFNVLKGDMSLVGNRPLPLYEAQELTSDEWALRFLGPAGITGLWQVTKRGKSEMSDEERRQLDNDYTNHFSFWTDLKILLKTIPAVFQKEKV
ncbi:sugar transferase [Parapedobacter sp. 10938]|uniref:sugar transferase n=1 Tax=Parapedobacter flavus TaxID=3110225 RepID=UPI002DBA7E11|nr:sugar transferase [Parapedobacter sp. 10938]MEC3879905.1 sugar transferase [Parapedobacter sp. 10938]